MSHSFVANDECCLIILGSVDFSEFMSELLGVIGLCDRWYISGLIFVSKGIFGKQG
jgi:hypothetical protein